jgi:flagellar hook-length control protein FliK
VGEAIIKRITLFTNQGGGEAVLDLDPPELGRLGVRLAFEDDRVSLHLHAANEKVAAFLEKNMEALRHSFGDLGMNVAKVTVTDAATGESHTRFNRNTGPGGSRSRRVKGTPEAAEPGAGDEMNRTVHRLDGDSVVDILV